MCKPIIQKIIFLLWFVYGNANAVELSFKGLTLDTEVTAAQVENTLATPCKELGKDCDAFWQKLHDDMKVSCGNGYGGVIICNGETTIAGTAADANVVIGKNGRLQRIWLTIKSDDYETVIEELLKKFGKPTSIKRSSLQNGFGARYTQTDSSWSGANGQRLLVSRYAGNIKESTIYFSTKADNEMLTGTKKGNSKDL